MLLGTIAQDLHQACRLLADSRPPPAAVHPERRLGRSAHAAAQVAH